MLIKDHWLYSLVLWAGCAVGHWRKHCIISGYKFIMQSPVQHTPESSFFIRYDFLCATWKDECTEVSHTYMHASVWCLAVSLAALAVTLWASRVENEKRLQTKSCIYSIGVWPFEGVLFESLAGILCSTNSRWNTSTGVKWKKECTNNDSAYDHRHHRFINLHLRCKLKGDIRGLGAHSHSNSDFNKKLPIQTEAYCALPVNCTFQKPAGPSCSGGMGGHIKKVILFEIRGTLNEMRTHLFSHCRLPDSEKGERERKRS